MTCTALTVADAARWARFTVRQDAGIKRRCAALVRILRRVAAGASQQAACRAEAVPAATYCRWLAAFDRHGPEGLAEGRFRSGRRPKDPAQGRPVPVTRWPVQIRTEGARIILDFDSA